MDDDGSRACPITAAELRAMLARANEVYAPARMRFVLASPDRPLIAIQNAKINSLMPIDHVIAPADRAPNAATIQEADEAARAFARRKKDVVTVYFRYGDGARGPTGNGFSSGSTPYVAMPGLKATNMGLTGFAHEVGHYFGLAHTFRQQFRTVAEAAAFLKANQNNPSAFDGDGFADTAPDPAIAEFMPEDGKVVINGIAIAPPIGNVMSYHRPNDRGAISPQQARFVRANYYLRFRTNSGAANPHEFEKLIVSEIVDVSFMAQSMTPWGAGKWSGDMQLFGRARPEARIVTRISAPTAGRFRVVLYATRAPDYGILQAFLDDQPLGEPFDGFAPLVHPSGAMTLGEIDLAAGPHALAFQIIDKHADSTNYFFGLDAVALEPIKGAPRRKMQ
jgi:hypothetical protein